MPENPGGGESDPAEGVRRCCMNNSPSVLSCIGKRTRECCDRGSEVGTVHSGLAYIDKHISASLACMPNITTLHSYSVTKHL